MCSDKASSIPGLCPCERRHCIALRACLENIALRKQVGGFASQVWEGGSRPEMKQRTKHEIGIDTANKQGKIKLRIHYFPGLYGCNDGLRLGLCPPSSNACMPSASGPPDTAAPTLLQRSPAFRRWDFHNCCKACRIIFHDCSLPQTGKIKHVFVCIF